MGAVAAPDKKHKLNWAWIVLIAVAVGAGVGLKIWWDRHQIAHGEGTVHSTLRLPGGPMVAIESVTITDRRRDPNTDQVEERESVHWRLRAFEEASGKTVARRVTESFPTCKLAKGARVWCQWDDTIRLLDAKLETVGEVGALPVVGPGPRRGLDELEVDVEGGLVRMGMDGRPERIDPVTMAVTRGDDAAKVGRRGSGGLAPIARVGGTIYQLSVKRGQLRATLVRMKSGRAKTLEPKQSWLADGFLGDDQGGPGDALALPDGFFLVHRDSIAEDAPRRLSRLTLDGKTVWTAALPEPVQTGALESDGVVVSGRVFSIKLSLADGKALWQTRH